MKILSVGNSFSQDAHRWLHHIAGLSGVSMETVNLYIGGTPDPQRQSHLIPAGE